MDLLDYIYSICLKLLYVAMAIDTISFILFGGVPHYNVYLEVFLVTFMVCAHFMRTEHVEEEIYESEYEDEEDEDEEGEEDEDEEGEILQLTEIPEDENDETIQMRVVITKKNTKYVDVNNIPCLDAASNNLYNFLHNKQIKQNMIEAIKIYGVGPSAPPDFYGVLPTVVDIHVKLEKEVAIFLKCDEAVVFPSGYSALTSVISTCGRNSAYFFIDEQVNFAIQNCILSSKNKIIYFAHNNPEDLESKIQQQQILELKKKHALIKTEKFLIIEGIYKNSGKICNLLAILEIKKRFGLKLVIDESLSIGTIGVTGRGITEFYDISFDDIDLVVGSLEFAFSTIGGFCAGSTSEIYIQRTFSYGRSFSTSQSTVFTMAAIENLRMLQENSRLVTDLNIISENMHAYLVASDILTKFFIVQSDSSSPYKFLLPKHTEYQLLLNKFVTVCYKKGLAICPNYYMKEERNNEPNLSIIISITFTNEDIRFIIKNLEETAIETFQKTNERLPTEQSEGLASEDDEELNLSTLFDLMSFKI